MEKIILSKIRIDPVKRIRIKTWLLNNYGKNGVDFFESMDGIKDAEKICSKANLPEEDCSEIIKYLSDVNAIEIKAVDVKAVDVKSADLKKEEIKKEKPKEEKTAEKETEKTEKSEKAEKTEKSEASEKTEKPKAAEEAKESKEPEKKEKIYTDPTEKEIFDLFGEEGIKVFSLIDGKRTVKEIIAESMIPKEKVIKIIKKINEIGVVKI